MSLAEIQNLASSGGLLVGHKSADFFFIPRVRQLLEAKLLLFQSLAHVRCHLGVKLVEMVFVHLCDEKQVVHKLFAGATMLDHVPTLAK